MTRMLFIIFLNCTHNGVAFTNLLVQVASTVSGTVEELDFLKIPVAVLIVDGCNVHNIQADFTVWEYGLV